METIAEMRGVTKRFRRTRAVDDLTLAVRAGVVTAFLGPNGAGKTTTIKCLLNLLQPDAGEIQVMGEDSRRLGPEQFRQIGYVSEGQELPMWMTVRQFLDYCRPMYPDWDRALENRLLTEFELPADTRLRDLSRGMRVKAALLSSLAYRPRLVVLDEPFSGLDPLVRDEFIRGLLELTEDEGWSVFVSSHDIDEVERLADRVAILNQGRLQLDEDIDSLQARFRRVDVGPVAALPAAAPLPRTWLNVATAGRTMQFVDSAYDEARLRQDLRRVLGIDSGIGISPVSLREIFVSLAKTYRLG